MTKPKRILVTGGAGFIASHVADQLVAAGHDVAMVVTRGDKRASILVGNYIEANGARLARRSRAVSPEWRTAMACP